MTWEPDYTNEFIRRQSMLNKLKNNPIHIFGAKEYYKTNPIEFINDWCITYDPRNAGSEIPPLMPFCTFKRQEDLINFFEDLIRDQESGLIEKSRDMGATWVCCAYSVWLFLFKAGSAVGWGSRKEQLVDRLGDPDSIFEKMRMIIRYLPKFFLPEGFNEKEHMSYMKIMNPETGASITGEAGDNIGRGGRKLIYFKDESAHYMRPEMIEASLGDNTNVQVDISSVNGTANVFYRKRHSGVIWEPGKQIKKGKNRILIMDWRDHPLKTQEWYDTRKEKQEAEGLGHIFAQEVDRDYSASITGVVIPAKWVRAAIDAHKILGFEAEGSIVAGLDVADEGIDSNAITILKGNIPIYLDFWPEGDTTQTAEKAVQICISEKVGNLQYDCIGVGAGVKGEINRQKRDESFPVNLEVIAWDAGSSPLMPDEKVNPDDEDGMINKDFYENLKAQAWWQARLKFEKTYKMINGIRKYPVDELISIPSDLPHRHQLENELSQPTLKQSKRGKLMIDKKPEGSSSPNLADSFIQAQWPVEIKKSFFYA